MVNSSVTSDIIIDDHLNTNARTLYVTLSLADRSVSGPRSEPKMTSRNDPLSLQWPEACVCPGRHAWTEAPGHALNHVLTQTALSGRRPMRTVSNQHGIYSFPGQLAKHYLPRVNVRATCQPADETWAMCAPRGDHLMSPLCHRRRTAIPVHAGVSPYYLSPARHSRAERMGGREGSMMSWRTGNIFR